VLVIGKDSVIYGKISYVVESRKMYI
jgi:hypothetical protein